MKTQFEWNQKQKDLILKSLISAIEIASTIPNEKIAITTMLSLTRKAGIIINSKSATEINENEDIQNFFIAADEQRKIAAEMTEEDYNHIFGSAITREQIEILLESTKKIESIYTVLAKLESDYKELTIEG
jgi:hypothetical protein